jgi:hypothetical protein
VLSELDPNHWQAVRPQVVLLAAQGLRNDEIAARVQCRREVITAWRQSFYAQCRAGLEAPRPPK